MWQRVIPFILLIYLLFNLPFFTLKQYRRNVYLYNNPAATNFIRQHPEIKNIVHLTKNPNLHPIFLITEDPLDTQNRVFDYIYISTKDTASFFINSIPTHAYIEDTVHVKTPDGNQYAIPINNRNNLFRFMLGKDSFQIMIKGIPEKIYVIDTIKVFSPYHGALRRYFESNPFISYIGIFPFKHIVYTKDSVLQKDGKFKPVMYVVGKNLRLIDTDPIHNPRGFYLAFKDTTFPVPIKSISSPDLKPDTVIAYLIGRKKYPLFFIKDGTGYFLTPEIGILAREQPGIFKEIMDRVVEMTSRHLVYAYPDKHVYTAHETSKITILSFPSNEGCVILRNEVKEVPIPYNRNTAYYTFTPSLSDTLIIAKCGDSSDTVHITIYKPNSNRVTFSEKKFLKKIFSETYTIKRDLPGPSSESTEYYLILLFILILLWIVERRKSLKHNSFEE